MKLKMFTFLFCTQLLILNVSAQEKEQIGYMPWHPLDTLRLEYLVVDTAKDSSKTCNLDILIKISGLAFTKREHHLAKSFLNWCVKNYMFDDSWIDTSFGIVSQIHFMQAQFDLGEIYARKLRKALYENGRATNKFVRTTQQKLLGECEIEFVNLEKETQAGKNKEQLERWRNFIAARLKELSDYASEERNTPKKIGT